MKRFPIRCGFLVVVLFAAFLSVLATYAQETTILSRYNEAIDNIVNEILEVKAGYPELESFSRSAVKTGQDGYKNISYVRDTSRNHAGGQDQYAYRFSINLNALDNSEAEANGSLWEVKFPLLGVKVTIDSQRKGEWTSFDLRKIVENNLDALKLLEQDSLPFRLEVSTDRQVYSVSEEIVLTISLKNAGLKPFKIADLDENALYCSIGDNEWGNAVPQVELNRVLSGRGTVQRMLRITAPDTPQELSIACTYALGYKGVQPYNRIRVSIQPKR